MTMEDGESRRIQPLIAKDWRIPYVHYSRAYDLIDLLYRLNPSHHSDTLLV